MNEVRYELPGGIKQKLRLFDDHFDIISTNKVITLLARSTEQGAKNVSEEDWADMDFNYYDVTSLQTSTASFIIALGARRIKFEFPTFNKDADLINEAADYFKRKVRESKTGATSGTSFSPADEILKYKSLLDQGIITQDEFALKKEELLSMTSDMVIRASAGINNTKTLDLSTVADEIKNDSLKEHRLSENENVTTANGTQRVKRKTSIKSLLLIVSTVVLMIMFIIKVVVPLVSPQNTVKQTISLKELQDKIKTHLADRSPVTYDGVKFYEGRTACVPSFIDRLGLNGYGISYDIYPTCSIVVDYKNVEVTIQEDNSHYLDMSIVLDRPSLLSYELDLNEDTVYIFDANNPNDWNTDNLVSIRSSNISTETKNNILKLLRNSVNDPNAVEYYNNAANLITNYCLYSKDYNDGEEYEFDSFLSALYNDIQGIVVNSGYKMNNIHVAFRSQSDNIVSNSDNTSVLFKIKMINDSVRIRTSPGIRDDNKYGANVEFNKIYDVYETTVADGYTWYKIGTNMWIADDGTWIQRVYENNTSQQTNYNNSSNNQNSANSTNDNSTIQNNTKPSDNGNDDYQMCLENAQVLADNYYSKQHIINDISNYPIGTVNKVMQNISVNYKENCKNALLQSTNMEPVLGDESYREQLTNDLFTDEEITYAFKNCGIDWEARATEYIEGWQYFENPKSEIIEALKGLSYSDNMIKSFTFDDICLLQSEYIIRLPNLLANRLKELGYNDSNIEYVKAKIDFNLIVEERVSGLLEFYDGKIYNSQISDGEIRSALVSDGFSEKQINHGMEYVAVIRNEVNAN